MVSEKTQRRFILSWGLALCGLRFFRLDLAPFILDEPRLQIAVDRAWAFGVVPSHGLLGTVGLAYGPAALWFYGLIRLISTSPEAALAAHAATFVLGFVLLLFVFRKWLSQSVAVWLFALLASSPYLFFYSREAWDNTLQVFFSAIAVFAVSLAPVAGVRLILSALLLGASCGLLLDTHLMSGPTVFVLIAYWVLRLPKTRQSIAPILIALLSFGFVTFSYFHFLYSGSLVFSHPALSHPQGIKDRLKDLFIHFRQSFSYLSYWKFSYFIDRPVDSAFPEKLSHFLGQDYFSWVLRLGAVWAVAMRSWRPVTRLAVSCILAQLFLFSATHVFTQPHYFIGIYWAPYLLVGVALQDSRGVFRLLLKTCAALTLLTNTFFILGTASLIAHNHGTRGIHYSTSLGGLQELTRRICGLGHEQGAAKLSVDLRNVSIFPDSVLFLASREPGCRGVALRLLKLPEDKDAQPDELGLSLAYANGTDSIPLITVSKPPKKVLDGW